MNRSEVLDQVLKRWGPHLRVRSEVEEDTSELECPSGDLREVCRALFHEGRLRFAGLIVEEAGDQWRLRYAFHDQSQAGWIRLLVEVPQAEPTIPTISDVVHAADWHEREAEDLFGVVFEGHPRLGDFVLHDDAWQEGVAPMRRSFDASRPVTERRPNVAWRPRRIVQASGSFLMPVGPVFSGLAESVNFQLETVGEDVIRAFPRLFYKYRGIEKIAEGKSATAALLLAERFSATTAFAHALAFCLAVERICGVAVPPRARRLRVFLAEMERLRHHVGAIQRICESTALAVAASQAAILEEELLRTSGALTEHRYLFGLAVPGGLALDLSDGACAEALRRCRAVLHEADKLWAMLRLTSSFIDRLEEVGVISEHLARDYGLVGPVARASGIGSDMRAITRYGDYRDHVFSPALEQEGDGYARLRVLFAEARESVHLMSQAAGALEAGPVRSAVRWRDGCALGAVEAPRGAAFHWLRLDALGQVARYRVIPPSFTNWHGFHLAVENFAFQDFPIILATLDLSVSENDR